MRPKSLFLLLLGFFLMNYIDKSFENVSLEVLRGTVSVMFQSGEGNGILLPGDKTNVSAS